jgi:hypothetical protein
MWLSDRSGEEPHTKAALAVKAEIDNCKLNGEISYVLYEVHYSK